MCVFFCLPGWPLRYYGIGLAGLFRWLCWKTISAKPAGNQRVQRRNLLIIRIIQNVIRLKRGFLFKIINKYYADAGLDRNFLELAIVKANRGAFVRNNPNFLYAGRVLHLPSVNQIKSMVMHPYGSGARVRISRNPRSFFFMGTK